MAIAGFFPMGMHAQSTVILCTEFDGDLVIESAVGVRGDEDGFVRGPENDHEHVHFADGASHGADCVDLVLGTGTDEDCNAIVTAGTTVLTSPSVSVLNQEEPRSGNTYLGQGTIGMSPSGSNHVSILSTIIFLT